MSNRKSAEFLIIISILNLVSFSKQSTSDIIQLNVLFRHGDRTPDVFYPSLPYTRKEFFPMGIGGLTNNGKARAYDFGQILRKKYNDFLGTTYLPNEVQASSSDFDRTKMTLQLVLAGLYPPDSHQKWKEDLNWQPVSTNYIDRKKDHIFQRRHICQGYLNEREKILKSPKIAQRIASYKTLMKNMTLLTGRKMTDVEDLYSLYANFVALRAMGLNLPNSTQHLFPRGQLFDAMITTLEIQNYNDVMKRIHGGGFVRQISENMIAGKNITSGERPRIYLYSGHDINILALLSSLNLAKPHLPEFSSAVVIELLLIKGNYYVKIWHHLGIPAETKELKMPDCSSPCPLDVFLNSTKEMIPSDKEFKCI